MSKPANSTYLEEDEMDIWEPQPNLPSTSTKISFEPSVSDVVAIPKASWSSPKAEESMSDAFQFGALSGLENDSSSISSSLTQCGKSRWFILGHSFARKIFAKPAVCHHCAETVWGIFSNTAGVCEICNFVAHDKCLRNVVSPCSCIMPFLITDPVSHCWSEGGQFKRKFCSVCRKRVDEDLSYSCEVCECYCHEECLDFVASNCKQCALSVTDDNLPNRPIQQYHHWREGNLPLGSRCSHCRKSCNSTECLTGMQCSWCNITAHAGCYNNLPKECNYGILRDIILPPAAVSLPRTSSLLRYIMSPQKPPYGDYNTMRPVQDEPSSNESKEESAVTYDRRYYRDKTEREPEDGIRVYDGLNRFRRRRHRTITVDKTMSVATVTEWALKACMLPPEIAKDFFLVEISERDNATEHPLRLEGGPFRRQLKFDLKRPHVVFFHNSRNSKQDYVNISPGVLARQFHISSRSKQIMVDSKTTVEGVLLSAIKSFGVPNINVDEYQLVQVSIDRGITEQELSAQDLIWPIVNQLKEESFRTWRLTTFHIRFARQCCASMNNKATACSSIARLDLGSSPATAELFVGNLKKGLSQKLYEKILLNVLGEANKWTGIEVIYYDFGSLVLRYASAEKADKAYSILKDSTFEDRRILVLVLPHIVPQMVPDSVQPLLVFVNVKSGGCQGIDLIMFFRKLLNPHQVFTLDDGGPLPGLHCFRQLPKFKILVCGGDGTVGWALSCLDNVGQDSLCSCPPIAIVPLGTGNDLARVLRWGAGYTGTEDPLTLLRDVSEAEEIRLDRWTVVIKPDENEQDNEKRALQLQTNIANTNEDTRRIFVMNNYFGIGIDADLNLDFHMAREENPAKFTSRIHNKGVYFKMGLRKMMYRSRCCNLQDKMTLEVDNKLIDLPPIEGIIILNILSWAGGANPWGSSSSNSGTSYYTSYPPNSANSGCSGSSSGNTATDSGNSNICGNGPQQVSSPQSAGPNSAFVQQQQHFSKPTHYDGMLEVVGVTGVVHMGQIVSGLRSGNRIAQGGHIRICLKEEMPVQVDGEPWVQAPGQIIVLRSALKATMLKKRKRNRMNRRNTDPSIGPCLPSGSHKKDTRLSDDPEDALDALDDPAAQNPTSVRHSVMEPNDEMNDNTHHLSASPPDLSQFDKRIDLDQ